MNSSTATRPIRTTMSLSSMNVVCWTLEMNCVSTTVWTNLTSKVLTQEGISPTQEHSPDPALLMNTYRFTKQELQMLEELAKQGIVIGKKYHNKMDY